MNALGEATIAGFCVLQGLARNVKTRGLASLRVAPTLAGDA